LNRCIESCFAENRRERDTAALDIEHLQDFVAVAVNDFDG
jgi:hypothetical protein